MLGSAAGRDQWGTCLWCKMGHPEHYRLHQQDRKCARCTWGKVCGRAKRRFPLIPERWLPDVGVLPIPPGALERTWVHIRKRRKAGPGGGSEREFYFACRACPAFAAAGAHLWHLQRHHDSRIHHMGVARLLQVHVGPTGAPRAAAPPKEHFLAAWKAAADLKDNQGVPGIMSRVKMAELHECLVDAKVQADRAFMLAAETITLVRDESKGMLIIRAMACSETLEYKSALLGLAVTAAGDAYSINRETRRIIKDFLGGDEEATLRFSEKIEAVCVDSASSELKSARLMMMEQQGAASAGGSAVGSDAPLVAANLKAIVRDRPHASRRITSRPWQAEPYIDRLAQDFIMGQDSIIQRIRHSTMFTSWYESNVERVCRGAHMRAARALGAAKHRFETWSRPFAQLVLTLGAVIRTAEQIIIERKAGSEVDSARSFLERIDVEAVVQLGMLADAADEAMCLTRLFDDEATDPAEQADAITDFKRRIETLFATAQPACFRLQGFTTEAITFLETQVTVMTLTGGRQKFRTLGGPACATDVIKAACVCRMREWVRMAGVVISAEFPDFELVNAFWVFKLAKESSVPDQHRVTSERMVAFRRLGQTFALDPEALARQWIVLQPIAQKQQRQTACSNREAWQHAARCKPRQLAAAELTHVLIRYLGWAISTSGVEHTFAQCRRVLAHRGSCSPRTALRFLRIIEPMPGDLVALNALVLAAQDAWVARHRWPCRQGRPKPAYFRSARKAGTRAAWLRERRAQVTQAVAQDAVRGGHRRRENVVGSPTGRDDATARGAQAKAGAKGKAKAKAKAKLPPPPPLQEEERFLRVKARKRKVEAYQLGQLLPEEGSAELAQEAAAFAHQQMKTDKTAVMAQRLRQEKSSAMSRLLPGHIRQHGMRFHLPPLAAAALSAAELRLLRAALSPFRDNETPLEAADVLIVPTLDSQTLSHKVQWAGMLLGAYLVLPSFFTQENLAVIKYKGMIRRPRSVFITVGFRRQHPKLCDVLELLCARVDGSAWKVFQEAADFHASWLGSNKTKRGQHLVLHAKTDRLPPPGVHRDVRKMHLKQFHSHIMTVDHHLTRTTYDPVMAET